MIRVKTGKMPNADNVVTRTERQIRQYIPGDSCQQTDEHCITVVQNTLVRMYKDVLKRCDVFCNMSATLGDEDMAGRKTSC